jgi:hypothetical protein
MDVISTCPLRVASRVFRTSRGKHVLVVVCKATLLLLPGESPLSPDQDDPNEDDSCWDGDPTRSLYAPSDIVPAKPRADVMLVGHAFAPGSAPAPSIRTRLVVGTIDKTILAFADQAWIREGHLLDGQPVRKVPLRYELAAGGPDTWNPVGIRADAPPDAFGRVPLPNLRAPADAAPRHGAAMQPVGFGPIAPGWPARREALQSCVGARLRTRWWEEPLPQGLDFSHFNVAPPDQQLAEIASNERILLEGLHAEHPRLLTRLPGIQPRAIAERVGMPREDVPLTCDTLWINTDNGICTLVWRGRVELALREEPGRVVIRMDSSSAQVEPPSRPSPPSSKRLEIGSPTATVAPSARGPAMPFTPAPPRAAFDASSPTATIPLKGGAAPHVTIPLFGGSAPPAPAPAPPPASAPTATLPPRQRGPVMPFGAMPPPATSPTTTMAGIPSPARPLLPFGPPAPPVPPSTPFPEQSVASEAILEDEDVVPDEDEEPVAVARPLPEAPPMIGPLARAELSAIQLIQVESPAVAAPQDEWPVDRCAAIAASIARTRAETPRILEAHGLDPASWSALTRHWAAAIRDETKKGKVSLLNAYDRAYVAQLERERGAITVEEYARLLIAGERDAEREALAELGLPTTALIRIERVWMERIAADPELGACARQAVLAAREPG